MIEDHLHHYQLRKEGGGLFSDIVSKLSSKTVADVGKKIATNAVDQGAKKAGEFLADKATKITKGLLMKTLKSVTTNSKDFVDEILSI